MGERWNWSLGPGALTADRRKEQMALKEATSMREVDVWEEGWSEKTQESIKREACGTKKNPQDDRDLL